MLFCFQVRVYDLLHYDHGPDDVLVLATDGLWDVLLNEEVAEAVNNFLPNCDPDDPHRFVLQLDSMSLAYILIVLLLSSPLAFYACLLFPANGTRSYSSRCINTSVWNQAFNRVEPS